MKQKPEPHKIFPKARNFKFKFHIPNYTFYANFDLNSTSSGLRGVAIYVADHLHSTQVLFSADFSEQLWLKSIYRSPSASPVGSTIKLCTLMNEVLQSHPPYLLLVGDFNYPGIDWLNEGFSGNVYEQEFYDTVNNCLLFQHVTKPTRYRQGFQPHILDLVLLIKVMGYRIS